MSAHSTIDFTETIKQYAKSIFGFALNRLGNRQEAEDLAQDILLQLLKSLNAGVEIRQMDAYVWTVARYTWVHWIKKHSGLPQYVEINGMTEMLSEEGPGPLQQLLNSETYRTVRRELTFLSGLQRRIMVMHYYDGMKQLDIAHKLNIPLGTVKWHLHDARNEIKKGMERMLSSENLSVSPIQLTHMGHSGRPGKLGDTWHFLKRSLTQNIVYAMYYKPMTVNELAVELGTPAHFIEDEVSYLAEYGFITEAGAKKYRTDFIIRDHTREQLQSTHELYKECAAQIADLHFDAMMDVQKQIEQSGIFYPENDYNFLLWTLLPKNIEEQGNRFGRLGPHADKVVPLRKDGGKYIAFAELQKEPFTDLGFNPEHYRRNGPMDRSAGGNLSIWRFDTFWSDRDGGWQNFTYKEVELCYRFWKGDLPENEAHAEDYALLLSKQYLLKTADGYRFNAVMVDNPETMRHIHTVIPDLSQAYASAITTLYEQVLRIATQGQPKHLEPQIAYTTWLNTAGGSLIPYVLKYLLDKRKLHEPLPEQRKTVTMLMGLLK
ncbi:RNA polymerase sigma factor [Paenibacillus allorhizosphaerae]|uniref:Sigma-70 family RNA polymerase sigma factor n=1 Tax=Paenibacillus allorhizosphaerae TaxID=2849866 RepID=A0ABN7THA0_9BACL|nr:RNA polymerase sigma factor [Paenibacillus allorhizosphaerae]CAG7628799.1 hypothetical protein PAECIP111802_01495 [Paenibacillus allorhizosphaerae]